MLYYLLTLILQRGSVQFAGNGYDFKIVCSFLSLIAATSMAIFNPVNSWHTPSVFSRKEVTMNTWATNWLSMVSRLSIGIWTICTKKNSSCALNNWFRHTSGFIDTNTVEKLLRNYILRLERNPWSMNEVWNHVVSGEKNQVTPAKKEGGDALLVEWGREWSSIGMFTTGIKAECKIKHFLI